MMGRFLEQTIVLSRWLLAPFYLGLAASLFVLLAKFALKLFSLFQGALTASINETFVVILSLIDLSLVANLLLLVIFVGWNSFIKSFEAIADVRPGWMRDLGFADLKIKLMTSVIAISAIKLLEDFMDIESVSSRELGWSVGIHLTFVLSAIMLAGVGRVAGEKH